MEVITKRMFADSHDVTSLLDLLRRRPEERIGDFPGFIDIRELMEMKKVREHTCLWEEEGGHLQGFAILDLYEDFNHLTVEVAMEAGADLEAGMIDWSLEYLRELEGRGGLPVGINCRVEDTARKALLEVRGFIRQDWEVLHLARSLAQPFPAIRLPDGFSIRPLAGEAEVEALVVLHQAAWGTRNMTMDYRLSMMRQPCYDPDLDLVAVAPDGRLAAYCICFVDREENDLTGWKDGYTDPLATHPEFQRLGLAKALLLTGMMRLKEHGMETARLGTSSENLAMQRAAIAMGFQICSRALRYEKG